MKCHWKTMTLAGHEEGSSWYEFHNSCRPGKQTN
jgi:hypothetical protein